MTDAPPASALERRLRPLERLPTGLRMRATGWLIGRTIPFVGTAGVRVHALSRDGVELSLPLRRAVTNHLGTTHAAGSALLAETAGGLAFAMHLAEGRTAVIKSMRFDYRRVSSGTQTARAHVPGASHADLWHEPAGEIEVPVELVDQVGGGVVDCRMVYAWFTR